MDGKYEPVSANEYYKNNKIGTEPNVYLKTTENGYVRVTQETQLDRIEKKLDSILEKLEGEELSVSLSGKIKAKNHEVRLGVDHDEISLI